MIDLEYLGWFATALFAVSYFVKSRRHLQYIQAVSATLWVAYGVAISSMPVIIANVIIILAALVNSFGFFNGQSSRRSLG